MTPRNKQLKKQAKKYLKSKTPIKYYTKNPKYWPQVFILQTIVENQYDHRAVKETT